MKLIVPKVRIFARTSLKLCIHKQEFTNVRDISKTLKFNTKKKLEQYYLLKLNQKNIAKVFKFFYQYEILQGNNVTDIIRNATPNCI